jgi:hypothetical protein
LSGLFGSAILDVAIGLLFIDLILSLVCSSLNSYVRHSASGAHEISSRASRTWELDA